jgi:hypothetical protein
MPISGNRTRAARALAGGDANKKGLAQRSDGGVKLNKTLEAAGVTFTVASKSAANLKADRKPSFFTCGYL